MPFWREVLADQEIGACCVIPVRHPLAVAGSLARRDGFPAEKSLLLWSAYMLAAEAYSRDLPRAFVSYDRLLADWRAELARIEPALGGGLPPLEPEAAEAIDRFLTPELRHNAGAPDLSAHGWAGSLADAVHDWFAAAAADRAAPPAALEAAAADLSRRREDIGALVSPAAHDLDVARAELVELRRAEAFARERAEDLETELERLRLERGQALLLVDSILARG